MGTKRDVNSATDRIYYIRDITLYIRKLSITLAPVITSNISTYCNGSSRFSNLIRLSVIRECLCFTKKYTQ